MDLESLKKKIPSVENKVFLSIHVDEYVHGVLRLISSEANTTVQKVVEIFLKDAIANFKYNSQQQTTELKDV